jgi:GT2 family glycosyltransferase
VTAIIPTRNRPEDLQIAVRTLLDQTMLPRELIIVDQSPQDDSERLIRSQFSSAGDYGRSGVALIYVRDMAITGAATARNAAIELATSDVVLFLDDDVELEPDFIENLAHSYERLPEVAGISGIITNYRPPGLPLKLWTQVFFRGPFHDDRQGIYYKAEALRGSEPIRVSRFGGGLMSFRAPAIRNVRFDANLTGASEGEDVDFCLHLAPGTKLAIDPSVRLVHKISARARVSQHWITPVARANVYLFYRNWNTGAKNRLCFLWLKAGFSIVALASSARRRSLNPWHSFKDALAEGMQLAKAGS